MTPSGLGATGDAQLLGSSTSDEYLFEYLADSHCHPQDDMANVSHFDKLCAREVAVMAEKRSDWQDVERIHELYSRKGQQDSIPCIYKIAVSSARPVPCFGIHPWFSHLHALDESADFEPLLESKNCDDVQAAAAALRDRGDTPIPASDWLPELRRLLQKYPYACVGEFGLDKAAILLNVGVRGVQPKYDHQTALVKHHLDLATEFNRPVSMHCVRCYGHMAQLFRDLKPEECPPKVMLHSFGGSHEMIKGFIKLPKIGNRFYFSFSSAINATNLDKLVQRIQAVPDDRLLLESDQVSALAIDAGGCTTVYGMSCTWICRMHAREPYLRLCCI
eukprot:9488906-Pyramimonas_sp.AAC.1